MMVVKFADPAKKVKKGRKWEVIEGAREQELTNITDEPMTYYGRFEPMTRSSQLTTKAPTGSEYKGTKSVYARYALHTI
jgi:hypothetical protein